MNKSIKLKHWENDKLLCLTCNKYLTIDNFYKYSSGSDHRNGYKSRCKSCVTKNRPIDKRKTKLEETDALKFLMLQRYRACKNRAKKLNLEFSITLNDLYTLLEKQECKCAISKVKFSFDVNKGKSLTNVSVDQILPGEGYVPNNIQLVCVAVNQMKHDYSMKDLLYFCEQILNNYTS